MYNKITAADIAALKKIVGDEFVLVGDEINHDYGHDELGGIERMPDVLVRVATTEEISAVMTLAYENNIPVTVRGSGTGLVGAAVAIEGGILLETTRMNKIVELDTDTMTVTVQPGVLLMELAAFCEENDLRFIATKVGDRFVLEEMLKEGYSFGGEQSGHVIFREYATTGDGQLTAAQLLSVIARTKKSLSDLNRLMVKYPQRMENIRVNADGKLRFYTDHAIKAAIDEAKAFLGETGRVVVRPSGTEPLIRVMAEGESEESIARAVKMVSDAIKSRLL